MIAFWEDLKQLFQDPLALEAIAALLLFVLVLILFRGIRRIAEELERRKALAEYVRGMDDALRGEYAAAIEALEKVLERDPQNVDARIALGDCYRSMGDPAEAKKHHHHVHRVFHHELARNFNSLGKDEIALGNLDAAVEAFTRVLELAPQDEEAVAGLAAAYSRGGDPIAAAETLRRIHPRGPGTEMSPMQRREAAARFADAGTASLQNDDVENAVRFYSEALAYGPEQMRARTGLLRAAHALGDVQRARQLVEEQLSSLRDLARGEDTLFEPPPSAPSVPTEEGGQPEPEQAGLLPTRVEELGGVVTAVEARTARYVCSECGTLMLEYVEVCAVCKAVGSVEGHPELAGLYMNPLPDIRTAVDQVEEGPAFLQRQARLAAAGDAAALRSLTEHGTRVLFEVFAALPSVQQRRYLGQELAVLGEPATREVRACHSAAGRRALDVLRDTASPQDEFCAGFFLRLGGKPADDFFAALGVVQDPALAGVMCDGRLLDEVRDVALERLKRRGLSCAAAVVRAQAWSRDEGGLERAAALFRELGPEAVHQVESRWLGRSFLGRLFRGSGKRQKAAASILARTGLPQVEGVLQRAAASEKDERLRSHYAQCLERARQGGAS